MNKKKIVCVCVITFIVCLFIDYMILLGPWSIGNSIKNNIISCILCDIVVILIVCLLICIDEIDGI